MRIVPTEAVYLFTYQDRQKIKAIIQGLTPYFRMQVQSEMCVWMQLTFDPSQCLWVKQQIDYQVELLWKLESRIEEMREEISRVIGTPDPLDLPAVNAEPVLRSLESDKEEVRKAIDLLTIETGEELESYPEEENETE